MPVLNESFWSSYHLRNSLKIVDYPKVSDEVGPKVDDCEGAAWITAADQGERPCKA